MSSNGISTFILINSFVIIIRLINCVHFLCVFYLLVLIVYRVPQKTVRLLPYVQHRGYLINLIFCLFVISCLVSCFNLSLPVLSTIIFFHLDYEKFPMETFHPLGSKRQPNVQITIHKKSTSKGAIIYVCFL